jgi:hypothetical protein
MLQSQITALSQHLHTDTALMETLHVCGNVSERAGLTRQADGDALPTGSTPQSLQPLGKTRTSVAP